MAVELLVCLSLFTKVLLTTSQPSAGFTEDGAKKRKKKMQQLCGGKYFVDVRGQGSEWTDWLEAAERQQ